MVQSQLSVGRIMRLVGWLGLWVVDMHEDARAYNRRRLDILFKESWFSKLVLVLCGYKVSSESRHESYKCMPRAHVSPKIGLDEI